MTFHYRSNLKARDKTELDLLGEMKNGRWTMDRSAYVKKIIELFVTNWEGVTEDGKPVVYSYDVFMDRFPSGHGGAVDLLVELSSAIGTSVGLFGSVDAEIKKND